MNKIDGVEIESPVGQEPYVKPEMVEQGSLTELTLDSIHGTESEGLEDNIVWGD